MFLGASTLHALQRTPRNAPILEEIRVEGTFGYHELPRYFLQQEAPSLRRLTITGCRIPWAGLPLAPRLTFLKLGNDSRYRPLIKTFLHSLCALHALAHLELTDFLPRETYALSTPPSLSNLRVLILADEANNVIRFFRSCRALAANRVQLTINGHHLVEWMSMNISRCLEALSETWKHPRTGAGQIAGGMKTLKLTDFDRILWDPCIECGFEDGSDGPQLMLEFRRSRLYADPLGAFAENLDLSSLQSLIIDNCEYIPKSAWDTIFSLLKKLKITFIQSSITTFLEYFSESVPSLGAHPRVRPRFGSLEVIQSRGIPAGDFDTNSSLSLAMLIGLFLTPGSVYSVRELRISDSNILEHTHEALTDIRGDELRLPRVLLQNVHVITATNIFKVASLDTGIVQSAKPVTDGE